MGRKKRVLAKMITMADLDADLEPGIPILELAGAERILIEKHTSMVTYTSNEICVKMQYGLLHIMGNCLLLERMTDEQLIIRGEITCIRIEKGGGC